MGNHIKIVAVAAGLLMALLATAHAESGRDAYRRCNQIGNPSAYSACAERVRKAAEQAQFDRCVRVTHNPRECR